MNQIFKVSAVLFRFCHFLNHSTRQQAFLLDIYYSCLGDINGAGDKDMSRTLRGFRLADRNMKIKNQSDLFSICQFAHERIVISEGSFQLKTQHSHLRDVQEQDAEIKQHGAGLLLIAL